MEVKRVQMESEAEYQRKLAEREAQERKREAELIERHHQEVIELRGEITTTLETLHQKVKCGG